MITEKAMTTTVTLIIAEARINDSGVYTCWPHFLKTTLPMANISVTVLKEDTPAQLSYQDRLKGAKVIHIFILVGLCNIL